ncbi:MAG: NADH-quinone oxidoreductase subunit A [Candidatus Thorarchaeota archaeon]|nr:NADH-quinone oxidoreductase subunit A [Candidatus Thorarchaeota archaeon]
MSLTGLQWSSTEMRLFIDFIPVLLWAIFAMVLVVIMLLASWVLRPHVLQNSEKTSTYECGEEPVGPARISYPYNYMVYTVLFVVIDVLGAFLYIVAASTLRLSVPVVWEVLLFVVLLASGVGYAMKVLPHTSTAGSETLALYRAAKAAYIEGERESVRSD